MSVDCRVCGWIHPWPECSPITAPVPSDIDGQASAAPAGDGPNVIGLLEHRIGAPNVFISDGSPHDSYVAAPAGDEVGDHERGCQGREYTCTCGYDDRVASALSSSKAEIAELRRSHDDLNRECDASLQTILSERARAESTEQALEASQAEIAELRAKLTYAEQANSTRPEYDLRCEECGRAHVLDTVLPSEIWNQIAESGNLLCVVCIDKRLAAKGLKAEAEFYFCGNALLSKLYNDESAEQALEAAAAERDEFRACLAVQCGQTLVAKSQLETAAAEKRVLLDALTKVHDWIANAPWSPDKLMDAQAIDEVVLAALAAGERT